MNRFTYLMNRFTYLALLLGWALPVIALHWAVGARELRARWRVLVIAVVVPTIYLTAADATAIGVGIWSITEESSIGLRVGSVVFEEALFFFLTNVLVAQSIILFLAPTARGRAWRLARRPFARDGREPGATGGRREASPPAE